MSNDLHGEIVIIKRNGGDGARFPLRASQCTFGRNPDCDIRIQIPNVAQEHAMICVENGKIMLKNLSENIPTLLNGEEVSMQDVKHNDVFTITERSFRFEFPERRKSSTPRRHSSSKKTPLRAVQGSPRTPAAGESLKKSITKLRRTSAAVLEVDEPALTPKNASPKKSTPKSSIQQKENTPEDELLPDTPSILKRKPSIGRRESDKKRVSFGGNLSPELFDKTLPPSTPLRKGTSPARRLSEPLQKMTPGGKSGKKRFSLGNTLGEMPILEEDEEAKEDVPKEGTSVPAALCDTPPQSLPSPLLPTNTEIPEHVASPVAEMAASPMEEQVGEQVTPVAEEEIAAEEEPSITPHRKTKRASMFRAQRLATPIRQQIHTGITFRVTKRKLKTPLRKEIQSKHELKKTIKKLATPLRKEIQNKPALNKVMKTMPTPIRKAIQTKPELKATKKKLATPLRKQILEKPGLRATKKKLATPIRKDIKKGVALRVTKKKLQTPLRKEIKDGVKLRKTKPTLATPIREEIKSKPQLRETKKRMRPDLQNEIVEGKVLQSKFKGLPKLPKKLKVELAGGKELNKTLKSAPTPFKNEIKEGVKLRETKKRMRQSLQSEIINGTELRKTKRSAPTPLRQEIKDGKELRKTKKTAPTPFRKEIKKGVKLRQTKKKLAAAIQDEIKQGAVLKKTKIAAPTPFRNEIKKGVKLRQTKKKLNEDLQKEIQEGKMLNKTKKTAPTPFRDEIRKGVTLRRTKKKLDEELQKEIKEGKELSKTKKTAPTPLRKEVKKGIKLRATKKRMSMSLQSRIRAGTSSGPLMRTLKTPVRAQIRAGANLRKTVERIATPLKKEIESRRKSLRSAAKEPVEESSEPIAEAAIIEVHQPQNTTRTILKAKRRLGNQAKVMPGVVPEIPRRLPEKIQKPAKKRVCRRSTPNKIAELRDQFEFMDPYEEESAGEEFDAPSLTQAEPAEETSDIVNEVSVVVVKEAEIENSPVEDNLGLMRLMKTPKVAKNGGDICGDFGTKRLLKTPKEVKKSETVEEHFGTKRLLKTPKEAKKNGTVEEHFGTKRLLKTPTEPKNGQPVEEHFGTKRLLTTPKDRVTKDSMVTKKLGLKRLMTTPKENIQKTERYSIEIGALPSMFKRGDDSRQEAVNDMQLQDLFVEIEPCCVEEAVVGDGSKVESGAIAESSPVSTAESTEEPNINNEACGVAKEATEESQEVVVFKETRKTRRTTRGGMQKAAEVIVNEVKPAKKTRQGKTAKVAEPVEVEVIEEECGNEVVDQIVHVDATTSEEVLQEEAVEQVEIKVTEQIETVVIEEECGNEVVDQIIGDNVAKIEEEITANVLPEEAEPEPCCVQEVAVNDDNVELETKAESSPMSTSDAESTVAPVVAEETHEVAKQDVKESRDLVVVEETRKTRRTTRGGMQKAAEVTVVETKPARQTRRGKKAKVAEPVEIAVIVEERSNEDVEENIKVDAAKIEEESTASVLPEDTEAEPIVSKPVKQQRKGRKGKAAKPMEEIAIEEESPKEALELIIQGVACKIEERAETDVVSGEAEIEAVVSKPIRQTRRGRKGKAVRPVEKVDIDKESSKENTAAKQEEEVPEVVVPENVVSKPARRTRRGKQEEIVQPVNDAVDEMEDTNKMPLGRRATRGKKAAASEKPAGRRGRRGNVALTTPEPVEVISDVITKEVDDKQESTEEEIACKPEQSSRPRRSRKSIEQVVERISRKRSQVADNKEASSEEEKVPGPSKVAKKRGGRKQKIEEDVLTGDEERAAGAVKGVVVTPTKMEVNKIKLNSIPEETASQIETPMVNRAQVETEAEEDKVVPVSKVARRTTRGRKRGADAIQQGDSVSLSEPPSKKRVSARQTRSKRS